VGQYRAAYCLVRKSALHKLPSGTVEFDELYNAGYIALVDAVERHDPERGSFTTIFALCLKKAFAGTLGGQSLRQRNDPLRYALSFDAPIGGEDDDLKLGDTIIDEDAEAVFKNVEETEYQRQLREELETALSKLPEQQKAILRRRYYAGETLDAVGASLHTTRENVRQRENRALRTLRRSSSAARLWELAYPGERWINQKTNFYKHTSVNRFNNTGISDVEALAIQRETWREGALRRELKEIDNILSESARIEEEMLREYPWLREKLAQMRAEIQSEEDSELFSI
jgi:RNA polymerase sigma factor, sigma-70 family